MAGNRGFILQHYALEYFGNTLQDICDVAAIVATNFMDTNFFLSPNRLAEELLNTLSYARVLDLSTLVSSDKVSILEWMPLTSMIQITFSISAGELHVMFNPLSKKIRNKEIKNARKRDALAGE